jgi:hypothetical protein
VVLIWSDFPPEYIVTIEEYENNYYGPLLHGLIFLTEDKHLAEKKAKMISKQLEIEYEIDKLNAEQGWVVDWKNINQNKLSLYFNHDSLKDKVSRSISCVSQCQEKYMSQKTLEKILNKYSKNELKQYLGIII